MLEPPTDDEREEEEEVESDFSTDSDSDYSDSSDDDTVAGGPHRSSARPQPVGASMAKKKILDNKLSAPIAEEEATSDVSLPSDDNDELFSDLESNLDDSDADSDAGASSASDQSSVYGDTDGYNIEDDREITITQPALNDAVEQGWHLRDIAQEDQDDDHLLSFKLGRLHASSGLRRMTYSNLRHEIDWALIELDPPRMQPWNLILGGRQYCKASPSFIPALSSPVLRNPGSIPSTDSAKSTAAEQYPATQDLFPSSFLPLISLRNLPVLSTGRTSGLGTGEIGSALSFIKLRGRRSFSSSWTVLGADFGIGGDSGAWVIDAVQGKVAGHVLDENRGVTYFCPMQVLIEDMRRSLGVRRVGLPGGEVVDFGEASELGGEEAASGADVDADAEAPALTRADEASAAARAGAAAALRVAGQAVSNAMANNENAQATSQQALEDAVGSLRLDVEKAAAQSHAKDMPGEDTHTSMAGRSSQIVSG